MGSVFISYRHENEEHRARVRVLAESLRARSIDVVLDQLYEAKHPGGPSVGWNTWSVRTCQDAAKILIVASDGWFRAFLKQESPGQGLGAAAEATTIFNQLYNKSWVTDRHRIVVLGPPEAADVPDVLKHVMRFGDDEVGREHIAAWIRGVEAPAIDVAPTPPSLRWPAPAEFVPDLANRKEHEWPSIVQLLSGRSPERIMVFEGESNHGKSAFTNEIGRFAEAMDVPTAHIDFKAGLASESEVMEELGSWLGQRLPSFEGRGFRNMRDLRSDLRGLSHPVLILFDSYERVRENDSLRNWIELRFLPEVKHSPGLAVVIAGQKGPDLERVPWGSHARRLELGPIAQAEYWVEWLERRFPTVQWSEHVPTLLLVTEGVPGLMYPSCRALAERLGAK